MFNRLATATVLASLCLFFACAPRPAFAADSLAKVRADLATAALNQAQVDKAQTAAIAAEDAAIKALQDQVAKLSAVQAPQPVALPTTPTTSSPAAQPAPAPAGQRPELLALAAHRPAAVAGVTFPVGPAAGTIFKNTDANALPSGWDKRTDIWWVYTTADNPAPLDGWDLTNHGWTVRILNKGAVVRNDKLTPHANGVGGAIQALTLDSKPIPGDVTITNNQIDGAKVSTGPGGLINVAAYGTVNIRQNYGLNAFDDFIDFAIQTPGDTTELNIVDNLVYNIGYGTGRTSDGVPTDEAHQVHADWIQVYHWDVGYGRILSGTVTGNVLVMVDATPHAVGIGGSGSRLNAIQGLFLQQAFWGDLTVSGNVLFTPLSDPTYGESVLHGIFVDTGRINGTFTKGGNYALMTGVSNFHEIGSTLRGTDKPSLRFTDDIDATTGAPIP
jgi:hypothetical protein